LHSKYKEQLVLLLQLQIFNSGLHSLLVCLPLGSGGIFDQRWQRLQERMAKTAGERMQHTPNLAQISERAKYIIQPQSPGYGSLVIINSTSGGGEYKRVRNRLLYEVGAPDALQAPENLLCIAGNIMSRGVTLEGLTVTFYGRDAQIPLGDASLQHARWLGHKGEDEVGAPVLGCKCQACLWFCHELGQQMVLLSLSVSLDMSCCLKSSQKVAKMHRS